MPTRADFEAAAARLDQAAGRIGSVTVAAERSGPAEILRGGTLGTQVADRIASCAVAAGHCQASLTETARLCRERVGIIHAYEAELARYRIARQSYDAEFRVWNGQYGLWLTGNGSHPGPRPMPPPEPGPAPPWADVESV